MPKPVEFISRLLPGLERLDAVVKCPHCKRVQYRASWYCDSWNPTEWFKEFCFLEDLDSCPLYKKED